MVLAFFSNQQTYDSVENAQEALNTVLDNGVNYVTDTIAVRKWGGGSGHCFTGYFACSTCYSKGLGVFVVWSTG